MTGDDSRTTPRAGKPARKARDERDPEVRRPFSDPVGARLREEDRVVFFCIPGEEPGLKRGRSKRSRHVQQYALAVLTAASLAVLPAARRYDKEDQVPPPDLRHDVVITATRVETPSKEIASSLTVISRGRTWPARRGPRSSRSSGTSPGRPSSGAAGPAAPPRSCSGGQLRAHARPPRRRRAQRPDEPLALRGPGAHPARPGRAHRDPARAPEHALRLGRPGRRRQHHHRGTGAGRPRVVLYGTGGALGDGGRAAGRLRLLGTGVLLPRGLRAPDGRDLGGRRVPPRERRKGRLPEPLPDRPGRDQARTRPRPGPLVRTVRTRSEIDNFGGAFGDDPNNVQRYEFVVRQGRASAGSSWAAGGNPASARRSSDRTGATTIPPDAAHPFDSEKGDFRSGLLKLDWQNNIFLRPSHTLTFGAEYEGERGSSEYVSESLYGPYRERVPAGHGLDVRGLRPGPAPDRRPVLRHGRDPDRRPQPFGDGRHLQGRPGLGRRPDGTEDQGHARDGLQGPVPLSALRPADGLGADREQGPRSPRKARAGTPASSRTSLGGRLRLGATWFRNRFRNLITFDTSVGYVNVGRARTQGVELTAEVLPSNGFTVPRRLHAHVVEGPGHRSRPPAPAEGQAFRRARHGRRKGARSGIPPEPSSAAARYGFHAPGRRRSIIASRLRPPRRHHLLDRRAAASSSSSGSTTSSTGAMRWSTATDRPASARMWAFGSPSIQNRGAGLGILGVAATLGSRLRPRRRLKPAATDMIGN